MMQEVTDRSSPEYQKLTWEALKKSLNGLVNKVNTNNIKHILPEVFKEVCACECIHQWMHTSYTARFAT